MKDVFSSYGTTDTAKTNKTVTVNITSTSNNNGSNSGSSTNNKNNKVAQGSSKSDNVSKSSSLPKTGLNPWLAIGVIIAIIGAVIGYIRYKKIY